MVTDVGGVYLDYGKPGARILEATNPGELREYRHHFPPGSMGPKVDAACEFVEKTGREAVIGDSGRHRADFCRPGGYEQSGLIPWVTTAHNQAGG